MVVRTAKNGFKWMEPPFTEAERLHMELTINRTPVAMISGHRRETPDTGSQHPAAAGSEATPAPTPTASSEQSKPRRPKK
jgi:hypothetical protein